MLDRLIDVRDGRHHDRLRLPFRRGELLLEQPGGIGLGRQLRLEIQSATEAEIFVVGPGETVNAAVLAAAIGIERPIKRHVSRSGDLIDDALRAIEEDLPLDVADRAVCVQAFDTLPIKLFAENVEAHGFEAIAGIDPRTAPMGRPIEQGIAVGIVVRVHT